MTNEPPRDTDPPDHAEGDAEDHFETILGHYVDRLRQSMSENG